MVKFQMACTGKQWNDFRVKAARMITEDGSESEFWFGETYIFDKNANDLWASWDSRNGGTLTLLDEEIYEMVMHEDRP